MKAHVMQRRRECEAVFCQAVLNFTLSSVLVFGLALTVFSGFRDEAQVHVTCVVSAAVQRHAR